MTGHTWLDIILYILIVGGGTWYLWNLYSLVESIDENIEDLKNEKHNHVLSNLSSLKSLLTSNKNEILMSLGNGNKSIKDQIAALKQMIQAQFSSQTVSLLEAIETNRKDVANLTAILQTVQSQTNQALKENSHRITELNTSLSYSISDSFNKISFHLDQSMQQMNTDEKKRSATILAGLDMLFRTISDFNKTIERHLRLLEDTEAKNTQRLDSSIVALSSSIKQHKESITSVCNQVLNTEIALHNETKNSFDVMNSQLSKYLSQLKQIDLLYCNLQKLYSKLLEEESNISKQEISLTSMVSRHTQILEITSEMNKTSKEIFEFMKLYLIQSTLDNFK